MTRPAVRPGETLPEGVEVVRHAEKLQAKFPKLAPCKSVWDCPVCAAREAVERTEEVRRAGRRHREAGGGVLLVTLTVRHNAGTRLPDMLHRFSEARQWLHRQRAFRVLMASVACVGSIRALEVTHGEHGWHPHTHELLFTAASVSGEGAERTTPRGQTYTDISPLAQFQADYYRLWKRAARLHKLQINQDGLHVRATDQATTEDDWNAATGYMVDTAEYDTRSPEQRDQDAARTIRATLDAQQRQAERRAQQAAHLEFGGGWDAAAEITAGTRKKARTKAGRTPMQLLSDYTLHDDQDAADLFTEFSQVFKGRRQLVWSDGLKARFEVDQADEGQDGHQVENGDEWQLFAEIPRQDWKAVLRAGGGTRGELLHHAAQDAREEFDQVLEECRAGTRKAQPRSLRSLRKSAQVVKLE